MHSRANVCKLLGLALFTSLVSAPASWAQQGIVLTGAGPINRSMGGAATAAPIDASGALYWNPATITGLQRSELEFGTELLAPQSRVSSSVSAGALAPGFPPVPLSGSTRGENGVFALPTLGFVYKPEDPDWTFGLGVFAAGGFGVTYAGSPSNPVLSPRPPNGVGLGPVSTQFQVLQIVPTAAYQITDKLSVGVAPVLDLALLQISPGVIAPPDDANHDGFATYPALTNTRYHFGGGFQAGLYYRVDDAWGVGCSIKSPQWFETFRFHSADELGRPRTDRFSVDFPMIVSIGASYSGFERWLLAGDVRYVDYKGATGFGASGFDSQGALRGLGWESTFGVSLGAQYLWSDSLALRFGYSFNENPISAAQTSENVGSSVVEQHAVYMGASYRLTKDLLFSAAYVHVFPNSIQGPLVSPLGPIPGTMVKSEITGIDSLVVGLTVQFGGREQTGP